MEQLSNARRVGLVLGLLAVAVVGVQTVFSQEQHRNTAALRLVPVSFSAVSVPPQLPPLFPFPGAGFPQDLEPIQILEDTNFFVDTIAGVRVFKLRADSSKLHGLFGLFPATPNIDYSQVVGCDVLPLDTLSVEPAYAHPNTERYYLFGALRRGVQEGRWKATYYDYALHLDYHTTYRHGLLHGPATVRDTLGHVLYRTQFREGTGYWKHFYGSRRVADEGLYRRNQQHGHWLYYDTAGTLRREEVYRDGQLLRAPELPPKAPPLP